MLSIPTKRKKDNSKIVNPEIILKAATIIIEEGCLSVPDQFAEIERPAECHLKYLDYNGETKELKAIDLLAVCIQHEIDHLERNFIYRLFV